MRPTETRAPATAKGEATRAFLLDTAAVVFARRGYPATTMSELILASGLTKGAFYFYFDSKADLALAVLQDQQTRWLERVQERVLSRSDPREQLLALVPTMLELHQDDPAAWSIGRLTRDLVAEPSVAAHVHEPMARWVALVADVVRRGQRAGQLRTGPQPELVAAVLVGSFDGLKGIADSLGDDPTTGFARLASTFAQLVEAALLETGTRDVHTDAPAQESPT